MKLMQILKNRKGFTLMELIVVMIILALLAAALLPGFMNFIRRANDDKLLAEVRVGQYAAQVIQTEFGTPKLSDGTAATIPDDLKTGQNARFRELIEGDVKDPAGFSNIDINTNGRINSITYNNGDGGIISIIDGVVSYGPQGGGDGGGGG